MQRGWIAIVAVFVGVFIVAGPAAGETPVDAIKPFVADGSMEGYKLQWHDEFVGDKVNTEEWEYRPGTRYWSVNKAENISVADGMMRIALKKEKVGKIEYTAGGLITKKKFKYGFYECRFKVPAGKGWHTSFWMMDFQRPADSPTAEQEIDVCENDSIHLTGYSANLHQWSPKHKGFGSIKVKTPNLSADFHTWGCQFTEQRIMYYFDGKPVGKLDVSKLKHSEMNIWLTSIASPLGKTDKVDDSKLPAQAVFDWVRYYTK